MWEKSSQKTASFYLSCNAMHMITFKIYRKNLKSQLKKKGNYPNKSTGIPLTKIRKFI